MPLETLLCVSHRWSSAGCIPTLERGNDANSTLPDFMIHPFQDRHTGMDAGQIGRIADLHLPEGQCTRMYIVNPVPWPVLSVVVRDGKFPILIMPFSPR